MDTKIFPPIIFIFSHLSKASTFYPRPPILKNLRLCSFPRLSFSSHYRACVYINSIITRQTRIIHVLMIADDLGSS